MNKANDLVSLVVPVYNVKEYIVECIDSIINQTYRNIEIILVDDGSVDGCSEICDDYARKDERIKVIHQENRGLSEARNVGLEKSNGKYIAFIDSDDYISPQYVEILYLSAIEKGCDIVCCQFYRFYNNQNVVPQIGLYETIKYSNIEAITNIYINTLSNIEFVVWNKLFLRDLFVKKNLVFPKGRYHEDAFITYKLLYDASSVAMINSYLYFYRIRSNSIMTSKVSEKRLDALYAHSEALDFFKENNEKQLMSLEFNAFCNLCVYIYYLTANLEDVELKKRMRNRIISIFEIKWQQYQDSCKLSALKKIFYDLFRVYPVFFSKLRCFLYKK